MFIIIGSLFLLKGCTMSSAKILIVEDEGLTAMELQRKLQYWGYEVPSFVFSGREAIKKVKEINPDLILMDIVLKGEIDGIDAAKEIIKSSKAPIIYLTAHGDNKTYERAMMTKHAAYILKPYDESELHRIIETTIYKNNLTKKLEKKGKSVDKSLKKSRGVIITDNNGFVHYINWEASKLTGWKKEQALNKSLKEILEIEDIKTKTLLNTINHSQEHVESSIGYSKLISADKTVRDIEYNLKPIKDDFGDFLGYSIIFQDITDIKRSNELDFISESDEQFKSIYSNSPIPCGLFESSGKLVDINKSFMKLIREDNISKIKEMNLFQFLNLSSKDKNDLIKGKTIEYEIKSESKNIKFNLKDETNTLKIIVNPLFLDEDLIGGYLIQMQDISNEKSHEKPLKKSENEYKELFSNIDDIFFELDSEMNVLFWNKSAEEFTDINSKQALGEQIFKLLPNLNDPELVETFDKALKNNERRTLVKKYSFKEEDKFLKLESYPSAKGISVIIKDFTEFEKDKKDSQRIQGFYRNLVDDQNDVILRFTLDGKITYANQFCLKNFGSDIVGKDILSIVIPKDRNVFNNLLKSIKTRKKFKNIQTRINNLENQVLTVDWAFNPVINKQENFSEIQAVGRDITKFIESEQSLIQDFKGLKKDFEDKITTLNETNQSLKVEIHKLEEIKNDLNRENLKLKSDLEVLVRDFDEERDVFNSRLSELEDSNESLTKENVKLNKKYDEVIREYEEKTNLLKTEISNLNEKNDSIKKEFNLFKKHSEKDIESYIKENEDLRTEIVNLSKSKSKLQQEYSDIKEKLEEQLGISDKLNSKINEFKNKEKLLKEEIEVIKSKFVEKLLLIENEKENMANEILELKKQLKSLNKLKFQLEEESNKHLEEFKIEKDALQNKIIEINSVKDSLSKKINEWEIKYNKDLERFQENEKFLKEFILNLKDKNSFLRMQNRQLDARINSKLEKFIKEKKELKRDIKKLKDENKDILNVINDKNSLINDMNLQINDNLNNISHIMDIQWEYLLEEINNKFRNNKYYIDSLMGIHEISKESNDLRSVNLSEYVKKMLDNLFKTYNIDKNNLKISIKINNIVLDGRKTFNCGLIINEFVLNSLKHSYPKKGLLEIEVIDQLDSLKVRLKDNRLSVPKEYHNLDSIGINKLKTIVKRLNGSIELNSDSGIEFIIKLPK